MGLGTVGSGVLKVLRQNAGMIRRREGLDIEIGRVLVRDKSKKRPVEVDPSILTTEAEVILNDPEIELIAEFMGGEEPAFTYIRSPQEREVGGNRQQGGNRQALV